MLSPQKMLMTVFGLGLLKPAPGTWGSTPPVIVALLLVWLVGDHDSASMLLNGTLIALGVFFSIVCITCGPWAEREFKGKDPGQVVADEVAGQCIALLFLPWRTPDEENAMLYNVMLAAGAFICFRGFDITKLPPINRLQSIKGGWGILIDDLVAGVYALAVMQLVALVLL